MSLPEQCLCYSAKTHRPHCEQISTKGIISIFFFVGNHNKCVAKLVLYHSCMPAVFHNVSEYPAIHAVCVF